jgi:hypothetical protein
MRLKKKIDCLIISLLSKVNWVLIQYIGSFAENN